MSRSRRGSKLVMESRTLLGSKFLSKLSERVVSAFWSMVAWLAQEWYGDHNVPWYFDMAQKYSFSSFRSFALSDFGQRALGTFLWMAGQVGLVPEEASRTEQMLRQASINLVKGGELKIFTPMYYVLAEKM
ncbi:unnamed protein product [Durusdinium trenchii]|uniref:Sterol methyltransferase C-terminal domain-containing protein n=1 Tax=Durusdinium trenchii TaxID=1381693 RepID=A0ABP0QBU8_9DINO